MSRIKNTLIISYFRKTRIVPHRTVHKPYRTVPSLKFLLKIYWKFSFIFFKTKFFCKNTIKLFCGISFEIQTKNFNLKNFFILNTVILSNFRKTRTKDNIESYRIFFKNTEIETENQTVF